MSSLEPGRWPLVLVLLLQLQSVKVQQIDPRLQWLNGQFQQFQALTQKRLNTLDLMGERCLQTQNFQYNQLSQDLMNLKQSITQEILGLRGWSRKLEEKSNQIEGRMSLLESNLRETRRQTQEKKPDLGQDLSNLTLELQSQEGRLAAVQAQHDELLLGLKGLQESLNIQVLRLTQVEGGGNVSGSVRQEEALNSNITHREYQEPRRRSQPIEEGGLEGV
ncbi:uncharacterized protein LOC118124044 [Hippoglossus stenolepis]|uniref:uncharacterized protein LOC118124044 n=1 Tax=Hippoglossus stenolepis TaxID=195615 RepID=UPI001FB03561|nr:uncharacterized protein LOC118124044 [Hippoglossus stenolepis]